MSELEHASNCCCLTAWGGSCRSVCRLLLLNGPSNVPQVPAECVSWIGGAPRQVVVKPKLLTKRLSRLYRLCLLPLSSPNAVGCRKDFLDMLAWSEKDPISISEHDIFFCHLEVVEIGCGECFWIARIKSLWACWTHTVTEDGETNLYE